MENLKLLFHFLPNMVLNINGRAKCKIHHIIEIGLLILTTASLLLKFWNSAFQTVVLLINSMPSPILGCISPFQLIFHITLNYQSFITSGCLYYPHLRQYNSHKLFPCSAKCILIRYSTSNKRYMCLQLSPTRVYITRHVAFDDLYFHTPIYLLINPIHFLHLWYFQHFYLLWFPSPFLQSLL